MPCVIIDPPGGRACLLRRAATRAAATPTVAAACALAPARVSPHVTLLSPPAGSFDPPTAAMLSTWREA